MSDLAARADRVKAIAECVGGKVLDRNGDTVRIEIPADTAPPGLVTLWGEGGFVPIFKSQDTRLASRRITNMQGQTVICEGDLITASFYRYTVDLRPR
jgi:hypothetical protein